MSNLTIPKNSLDKLKMAIRAYNLCSKPDVSLTLEEISEYTGYPLSQLKRSNSFLIDVGFLSKTENKFALTQNGKIYADYIEKEEYQHANEKLNEILQSYHPINLIITFVKLYRKVSKEQLVQRIVDLSGSNLDNKDHSTGINCLIDLLVESKIFEENNGEFLITIH